MSLIAFASAKGSPGVTTTVVTLAHVWPAERDLLVAELDPAGGDLAARLGLTPEPGLASLAAAVHRVDGALDPIAHTQASRGLRLLLARPGRRAAMALQVLGPGLGSALADAATTGDILADLGRLDPDDPLVAPHLARADLVVLLSHPGTAELAHALAGLTDLEHRVRHVGVVLVGHERDTAATASTLGSRHLGSLPEDPRGAATFGGAPTNRWLLERLPLVRAARLLAEKVCSVLDTPAAQVDATPPVLKAVRG
jgi:hypothetical protein